MFPEKVGPAVAAVLQSLIQDAPPPGALSENAAGVKQSSLSVQFAAAGPDTPMQTSTALPQEPPEL